MVFSVTFRCVALVGFTLGVPSTLGSLSLPPTDGSPAAAARAAAIADLAKQISNGPRNFTIGGIDYPFYYGPKATPGSVAEQIQQEEVKVLRSRSTTYQEIIASLASNTSASFTSLESFADLYDKTSSIIAKPMSTDISDEIFGLQRHTIKGYALRQAKGSDLHGTPLSLTSDQLTKICGVVSPNKLFVEDFHDIRKYDDTTHPNRYTPNVVGFFCANPKTNQLLPIEIRLLDTNLTYTPLDAADDWTLAKMALETSSNTYHQMAHMAETHAVTIPLRVELFRTMGADHPIRALLLRHVFADFGLEYLIGVLLLNPNTVYDLTTGWGGVGATKFLYDHTQAGQSVKLKAFPRDVGDRGLDHFPGHKFVAIGSKYWDSIRNFVDTFLDVYYKADRDVVNDHELQAWAKTSALIPHIRDFPTSFQSKGQLRELLTHLIFSSTVKHHTMNGLVTWQSTSFPYSVESLWHPLPTSKGQPINLMEYVMPTKFIPSVLSLAALFAHDVPEADNMFSAYKAEPFVSEIGLQHAIANFDKALECIEQSIERAEAGAKWPFLMLRPSTLPYYTWV